MPRLRIADPLWLAHRASRKDPRYPRIASDLRADVAIVGGGITGATVAWMFARAGARVVVLEAARVGRGSTAASTALLMQEPDTDFAELARRYGPKNARRVWRLSSAATRDFVRTLEALDIRCRLEHRDSVYYALGEGAAGVWQYFERRYPALEHIDIDFAWEGLFAATPDGLPYVGPHPDYPKHLFALGYGGKGMTFGFLAARLLLEWYRGKRTHDHRLFGFDRTVDT